jgi:hypothetical protein
VTSPKQKEVRIMFFNPKKIKKKSYDYDRYSLTKYTYPTINGLFFEVEVFETEMRTFHLDQRRELEVKELGIYAKFITYVYKQYL